MSCLFVYQRSFYRHALLSILCLLYLTLIQADTPPQVSSLSSEEAHYDGSSLELKGRVVLDHEIGQMRAEEALLARQETGSSFPFASISLKKEVHLALKETAEVLCEQADLDFTALQGILVAREGASVRYTDRICFKKGAEPAPLELNSSRLHLAFSKHDRPGEKTEYAILSMTASDQVGIDYAGARCRAHEALYKKSPEGQGSITAYPLDAHTPCQLSYLGSEILSDQIDLDLAQEHITLLEPRGTLQSEHQHHLLRFQAHYLRWDRLKQHIELKQHITLNESSFGELTTEDTLWITHHKDLKRFALKSLRTQGPATLRYHDSQGAIHTLIASGPIHLDQETLKGTLEPAAAPQQLCYKTEAMTIYADKGSLDYVLDGDKLLPTLIALSGSVRLISIDAQGNQRVALADRLLYAFDTRSLILSANPGKKVLFSDASTGAHLSAPEVHVTRNPLTQQEEFKGIGAVQFVFTPDEEHILHHLFPNKESP